MLAKEETHQGLVDGPVEVSSADLAVTFDGYLRKDDFNLRGQRSLYKTDIASDGSTILKIFYEAQDVTLNLDLGSFGAWSGQEHNADKYKADRTVKLSTLVERPGYDFVGWASIPDGKDTKGTASITLADALLAALAGADPTHVDANGNLLFSYNGSDITLILASGDCNYTIGAVNVTLYAVWKARSDSVYTVEHYRVTGDNTLKEVITETLHGITDDPYTAISYNTTTGDPRYNASFTGYAYKSGFSAAIGGQTLSEILTGTVLADGTLVLKLYYEPTAQSITLNTGAGAWNDSEGFYNATWNADKTQGVDSTIPTEKTLTVPSRNSATRDGYTLAGWTTITTYDIINGQITAGSRYNIADATGQRSRDIVAWLESLNAALAANPSAGGTDPNGGRQYFACGTSFVLPPNGAVLIAVWQANTNTAYTVEHIKLVNDGTTITEKIELTENLTGITGETVTGIAQTYPGYTFVANGQTAYPGQSYVTIAQGVIAGNGSLVLKLYYTANTNTTYTVERWIASADGKLLTKVDVKTLTGTTDTSVTPASSDPLGYTLDNSFVPSTISGAGDWPNAAIPTAVIAGDGSTKIIQFYIPIDVLYTVEFYRYTGDGKVLPFNGFETAAGKDYAEFIAGSSVPVWIDGTSTGTATNKVKGWGKTSSTLSVDRPAGISASAGFTYAHLNLSAAENPNFIGYTYDETFEQVINGVTYKTIAQGTILADGSLLLKLFYVADTLNLVYNTGSEATTVTFQKNHSSESTFTLPIDANEGSIVERDGYTLVGWTVASHYTGTDAASFALVGCRRCRRQGHQRRQGLRGPAPRRLAWHVGDRP